MAKKSDDAPVVIVDDQGNKWRPFINCNVIRLFEEQSDTSIEQALGEAVNGHRLAKSLRLAYLACAEQTKETDDKEATSLDDFCAGFESDTSTLSLVQGVINAQERFFQSRKANQNKNASPSQNDSAEPAGAKS